MHFFKQYLTIMIKVLLFISYSNGSTSNSSKIILYEPYSFSESFEKNESNPVKYWVTNLDKNSCKINYSFNKNSYTEGNTSLKIDIDSKGLVDSSKKWYYYLDIPLTPAPNLDGNLSFSIDVKMDKESAKNIQIGFNLKYLPITSGIHSFKKIDTNQSDKWITIKHDDLKAFTLNHATNFISNIYESNLSSFGRAFSNIAILIRGRGPQKYQINLDNLKIDGNIKNNKEFVKEYNKGWNKYIKKVKIDIRKREELYSNLLKKFKKRKSSSDREEYKNKIDSMFKEINSLIKSNRIIKVSKIELLDSYLRRFKSFVDDSSAINLYKMPSMKYYRLTGYNTPLLNTLRCFNLRMTTNEYKSIAFLIESVSSWGIHSVEFTDFIGQNNNSFSKDSLDLFVAKIWYQSGIHNTLKTGRFLTQELLLKDETLVKVDLKKKSTILG